MLAAEDGKEVYVSLDLPNSPLAHTQSECIRESPELPCRRCLHLGLSVEECGPSTLPSGRLRLDRKSILNAQNDITTKASDPAAVPKPEGRTPSNDWTCAGMSGIVPLQFIDKGSSGQVYKVVI